ncbi:MAG: phosphoribosylformylglycinamidine synthase subunit PurL [Bacteroidales bacterium]|mgnify:CR=1 FL=1|nr:phosphoribosylformylglycinamidine synthase subunit PurL [Bacteroidales bacterium]MDD7539394.1 phosphoribosylformylglycinamidine synthase subunit PurL [Bacteroidales bacterium]MDD7575031.1 phosphoribosylformylglycinamidine synthase subunit PurL [Bacteroidales bacterium]MDY3977434.1 phosphoribosylformylglycinamidine synthase subunit PurL [Candidatus Onthomorpha sp.]MDY5789417.1 phosphoribosylformylglycinamidine synthase subunit PurL [Candidatus Onthomorpha sp.]
MANNQIVTVETAKELGLLPEEFEKIKEYLGGRTPNYTELSIYSVMWSEHASYKNSIKYLKTLPKEGKQMLVKPGEENAGMVDVGGGLACVFKIESHNHPCAVEPFQGAATGVGGINRDIFTMGARPVAQLNSLRFGDLNNPHTQWLVKGVTKGISHYGNAFGVPVLAGEVFFNDCFEHNPLVNAMSVGVMRKEDLISAVAKGKGNPIYIVGSATGKDGIHGATFASADVTENTADDIPSIQVGDPFQEKLLLEATLELGKSGAIVGMQDMGAAGIICSTSEMSEKGGSGMVIDLDKVPLRQQNMEAWEILLSESQERMLVCVKKGQEETVEKIFEKWDLNCAKIGEVIDEDMLYFHWKGELVAQVPAASLVLGGGAPVYERSYKEPAYYQQAKEFSKDKVTEPDIKEAKKIANFLAAAPNIASKRWVYEQYDSMVGTRNMSTNRPSDAGVANLKGTDNAIAMTCDCNSRYVYSDPCLGTQMAVAEAARNIVCAGGEPLAITDCLNFGNPYNEETYWQFVKSIEGMGIACRKFNTPVTGGNVSFYNQASMNGKVEAVYPSPVIGMIGTIEKDKQMTMDFKTDGATVYLIGEMVDDISCSEYLYSYKGIKLSHAPYFDIDKEANMQKALSDLINQGIIESAHDVSEGGLFIAMLESAMCRNFGFELYTSGEIRLDSFLFGEGQGRVVVTVKAGKENDFIDMLNISNVPCCAVGSVRADGVIMVDEEVFGKVSDFKTVYDNAIGDVLDK